MADLWGPWGETTDEMVERRSWPGGRKPLADGYMECSIYAEHGACSCSTGVAGNVCPLGADLSCSDLSSAIEQNTTPRVVPETA